MSISYFIKVYRIINYQQKHNKNQLKKNSIIYVLEHSMVFAAPDTLVLKIVENDVDLCKPDTILYILYDVTINRFIIRGKRDSSKCKSCTYSFECELESDLVDFLDFVLDKTNRFSYILYNYDNLPSTSNEITFEFLKKYDCGDYEISGYDDKSYKKNKILKMLRMLKSVFNYY